MSSVNDSPNHLMVLDAISRGMKPVGKLAKVTRLDKALVETVVNDLRVAAPRDDAEQKGFFGGKKERNND
jgi:hypothetical protein